MFGRLQSFDDRAPRAGLPGQMSGSWPAGSLQRAIIAMRETAEGPLKLLRIADRALACETNLSLYEIASRTGFSSPSTLARAYRQKFGETHRHHELSPSSPRQKHPDL